MARPLQHHHHATQTFTSISTTTSLLLVLASITTISSIIIWLCTSHKHSKMSKDMNKGRIPAPRPTDERKILSGISSKALVVAKMVSWKKDRPGSEEEDEALWKKSIMMGEKCRPLEFSGQIVYDAEGNQLPEIPPAVAGGGGRRGLGSVEKA